ncbi:hypothetical protein COY90_02125 [Candidatus Roizmanbacteria bacterium CG_4_10_14_0_8_um_filter_39_9]|uniref:DUF2061 domain-containing protein n=1 Tax=Candidatus Roizmanbacteria bacterium CG_4_10_14_0_8_um_filter_39_9 TaxID=1974829 RepID=A0A2M7QE55_9BACT|nr:MAG: hypothetical protein COY90_02125 [Candidatus Roizmanbacteria bacterium CG_4_10_14_0_8_um_filter_39_9]
MSIKFHEGLSRSTTKAITFRLFILVSDGIIIFASTHRYDLNLGVILFSNIASTLLYIVHERLWNNVHWGKMSKKFRDNFTFLRKIEECFLPDPGSSCTKIPQGVLQMAWQST